MFGVGVGITGLLINVMGDDCAAVVFVAAGWLSAVCDSGPRGCVSGRQSLGDTAQGNGARACTAALHSCGGGSDGCQAAMMADRDEGGGDVDEGGGGDERGGEVARMWPSTRAASTRMVFTHVVRCMARAARYISVPPLSRH